MWWLLILRPFCSVDEGSLHPATSPPWTRSGTSIHHHHFSSQGRQKSNCSVWGLLITSGATPAGMFQIQPRGRMLWKKSPCFLWSRDCPHQVQNLLCLGGELAHLQGEGHNADSNSTFLLHLFQLQQILLSPITVPAISPTSHTFYSGFFFSLKRGKKF